MKEERKKKKEKHFGLKKKWEKSGENLFNLADRP